ncbi:MAG: hypothetical protein IM638_14565 [Bacteroidetes bacterium]|nr:hypothetical protein [Bacteroidota bacterium]
MRILFLLFLLTLPPVLIAQPDSALRHRTVELQPGIYLSFDAFKANRPVPLAQLISAADREAPDFMSKTVAGRNISWRDSAGVQHDTLTSALWGYCFNRHIYIRTQEGFTRLMVVGTLCHFTTTEMNYLYTGGPVAGNAPVRQQMQYVLDTYTGSIALFTPQFMLSFLETHDEKLAAEFRQLNKRKRAQQLFIFLKRFNAAHPLTFK